MVKKKSCTCAKCPTVACTPPIKADEVPSLDRAPDFCPMKVMPDVIEKAISEYDKKKYRCPKCKSKKVKQQITAFRTITSRKS